jgi:hypothetical protein
MFFRKVAQEARSLEHAYRLLDQGKGYREYEPNLARVMFRRKKAPLERLKQDGFEDSLISIPEPGQARFMSWRHPKGYHVHDHGDMWVMHKDEHAPSPGQPLVTAQHIVTEGVPGALRYVKHQLQDGRGLVPMMRRKGS